VAARIRTEPAVWLAPISVVLGYLVATDIDAQVPSYAPLVAVRAHASLIVLAPIGATAACWSAGRLRRARWTRRRWARSPARQLAASVVATTTVQFLAYVVVRAAAAATWGGPVPVEPALSAVAVAVLAGWAALGFLAGWWVRTEVAVPATLITSYLLLVSPIAMEPLWLRHLTGTYLGCCLQEEVLAADALAAAALLGAGVVVVAALLVRPSWRHLLAVVVVAAFVAASSVHVVQRYEVDPTTPRGGPLVCAGSDPVVCTWPERHDELGSALDLVTRSLDRWADAGLVTPNVLTPGPEPSPAQIADAATMVRTWRWDLPRPLSPGSVASTLAYSALPTRICSTPWAPELWDLSEVVRAELAVIGGEDPARARTNLWIELRPVWRTLHAAPEDRRVAWLVAMLRSLATCAEPPPIPQPRR
jgi:hypothetical protein